MILSHRHVAGFYEDSLGIRRLQYYKQGSPRISIVDLIVLTSICAITIRLMTTVGFLGVHGMFIVCLFVNVVAASNLERRPIRFRMWNQFTWGILLPLVCIFGDPFVFGTFQQGQAIYVSDYGIACYAFVGVQMIVLLASWYVPECHRALNLFVAGVLFLGGCFAIALAVILSPLAFFGTLAMGLGIPGFVPWFTGFVFINTSRMHLHRTEDCDAGSRWFWVGGFTAALLAGVVPYWLALTFQLGFDNPSMFKDVF